MLLCTYKSWRQCKASRVVRLNEFRIFRKFTSCAYCIQVDTGLFAMRAPRRNAHDDCSEGYIGGSDMISAATAENHCSFMPAIAAIGRPNMHTSIAAIRWWQFSVRHRASQSVSFTVALPMHVYACRYHHGVFRTIRSAVLETTMH